MSRLSIYLRDVAARGLRICEHPDYGGVNPALHMAGSMHGKGRAADLNYGPPGSPPEERPVLLWAARLADAAGLNVIYAYHRTHPNAKTNANHRDHLHVDDGPIQSYKAPGRDDALYNRILEERDMFTDDDRAMLREVLAAARRDREDTDKLKAATQRNERRLEAVEAKVGK